MHLKRTKTSDKSMNDEFLTRAEIIRTLDFPQTNKNVTIVKPNLEGIGFKYNCYSDYLQSKVEKSRFDETVHGAHIICVDVWNKKKQEEHKVYNKMLKYLLYIAFATVVAAFALTLIDLYGTQALDFFYPTVILFAVAGGMALFILVKIIIEKPKFIQLEITILERIFAFLEKENNSYYHERGLEWSCQKRYFWLECRVLNQNENK